MQPYAFGDAQRMKLIIQIPCYNEEKSLPITLAGLPRNLPGVDVIEWLIIDDGSTDGTIEAARKGGVDHIIRLTRNRGLARAFTAGIEFAIMAGADIIVNTDADNQYNSDDIPKLIQPIIEGTAEIVIGERPIDDIAHFSPLKKILQRAGSRVVRMASGTDVPDAPSGFRAFSKDAAMRLSVFNDYTYTLETIIQAGRKNMAIVSVPVRTNPDLRPSRLVRSIPRYVLRSTVTIARILMTYRPFRFFATPGLICFIIGLAPSMRFLYYWSLGMGDGKLQSLMFAILMLGTGVALIVVGLIADLIGVNRMLLEEVRFRLRQMQLESRRKK
jgi:glycosyltransferase involved in cell wall biosynthesis